MKKLIIAITSLFLSSVPAFAGRAGLFTGSNAYPVNVTVSSSTATTLFTNDGYIESVQYENRTGYNVYLATWAITPAQLAASEVNTRSLETGKWPPFEMENTNYRFAISSAATPSASKLYIDINK